jgi:hypothetical protein
VFCEKTVSEFFIGEEDGRELVPFPNVIRMT